MDVSVHHLRVVIALKDAGSIAEASRRLRVAQPALTRQLQRIEAATGRQLFERARTGLILTAEGAEFLSRARRVLESFDELIGAPALAPPELLRVATHHLPVGFYLQRIAPELGITTVAAEELALHAAAAKLAADEVDLIAYVHWPHTPEPAIPTGAHSLLIAAEPMALMLHHHHPNVNIPDPDLALFANDDWIAQPGLPTTTLECEQAGFTPRITHTYENQSFYMSTVGSGAAIAFCSPTTDVTNTITVRQYYNASNIIWALAYNPHRVPDATAHEIRDRIRDQRRRNLAARREAVRREP